MSVEIFYCPVREGYDERAASLAAELEGEGLDARAVKGAKSQFDVLSDGALVYSKQREGRFPNPGEVLALLQG